MLILMLMYYRKARTHLDFFPLRYPCDLITAFWKIQPKMAMVIVMQNSHRMSACRKLQWHLNYQASE